MGGSDSPFLGMERFGIRALPGRARKWGETQRRSGFQGEEAGVSGFVQVWRMIVTRGTYLAKAVQGSSSETRSHGHPWAWWRRCPSLQQHPQVAPGQSWGPGGRRLRESQVGKGEQAGGQHHPCVSPGRTGGGGRGRNHWATEGRKEKQRRAEGTCSEGGTIPVPVLCFLHP